MKIDVGLGGTYEIEVLDKSGKRKRYLPEFKNLVLNSGLDRYMSLTASNAKFSNFCFVGSGNTPPQVTDTFLQAPLGEAASDSLEYEDSIYTAPRWLVMRQTYTFAVGAVVGDVREIGVGWKVGIIPALFSRSLMADSQGQPTTVRINADEQLRITYRLYVKIMDDDITFDIVDQGITYTVTGRQLFNAVNTYYGNMDWGFFGFSGATYADTHEEQAMPPVSGNWTTNGTTAQSDNYAPPAYVPGSFTQTLNARFDGSKANYPTGIGSVMFATQRGAGNFMFSFSPKIPKAVGDVVSVKFFMTVFRGSLP